MLTRQTVISTGGDGSFFHAGLLALQSAVENGIDLIQLVELIRRVERTNRQRVRLAFYLEADTLSLSTALRLRTVAASKFGNQQS